MSAREFPQVSLEDVRRVCRMVSGSLSPSDGDGKTDRRKVYRLKLAALEIDNTWQHFKRRVAGEVIKVHIRTLASVRKDRRNARA